MQAVMINLWAASMLTWPPVRGVQRMGLLSSLTT